MIIQIVKQEENLIEFLVEREKGTYNNCNLTATFTDKEIENLTDNQIKTLAYDKVKHVIYRVFNQIEPLDEEENPVDFELDRLPDIPSGMYQPKWNGVEWIEGLSQDELEAIEYEKFLESLKPSTEELEIAKTELIVLNLMIEMEMI